MESSWLLIIILIVVLTLIFLVPAMKNNAYHGKRKSLLEGGDKMYKVTQHHYNLDPLIKTTTEIPKSAEIQYLNVQWINNDLHVLFYVMDVAPNQWNLTQNLYGMIFGQDEDGTYYIKQGPKRRHATNQPCTVYPEISDIQFNKNARTRDPDIQKKNWDIYKKQWDVNWSDHPHLRDEHSLAIPLTQEERQFVNKN